MQGWTHGGRQHDFQRLMRRFGDSPFHGVWNARYLQADCAHCHDEGSCEQMIFPDISISGPWNLQDAIDEWHRQAFSYTLVSAPQWMALRFSRFQKLVPAGPISKVRAAMTWCTELMLPVFVDSSLEVQRVRYCIQAFAVHLGESITVGHYKALLYNVSRGQLHYCNDGVKLVLLTNFDEISGDVYAVLLTRSNT